MVGNMKRIVTILVLLVSLYTQLIPISKGYALSSDSETSIDADAPFYVPGTGGGSNLGTNSCNGIGLMNIVDEAGVAKAINDYIDEYVATTGRPSPYQGLGQSFVTGAKSGQVNPFLAVAQLQHESSFATASDGWHTTTPPSHNGFGRSATASQPHTIYNGSRLVYQWSSWQDSLEGPNNWFIYINDVYIKGYGIAPDDLAGFIHRYAPKSDGNNEEAYVRAIQAVMNKLAEKSGAAVECGGSGGGATDQNGNKVSNVELGQRLAADRGFTGEEWTCLLNLWTRESNWHERAINDAEGNNDLNDNSRLDNNESISDDEGDAYGVPQSLPGGKMSSKGSDWRTNPETQIQWGLDYITERYTKPCGAWQHSEEVGWY